MVWEQSFGGYRCLPCLIIKPLAAARWLLSAAWPLDRRLRSNGSCAGMVV